MDEDILHMIFKEAEQKGYLPLFPGVYLGTQAVMIEEQGDWDELDPCKDFDFSTCTYWVIDEMGSEPKGINTVEELNEFITQKYR